jgi:DNA-binding beta-propeller fold protein YncE
MKVMRWVAAALILLSLAACAGLGEFASDDPDLQVRPGAFEGRFLAASDADMVATAYADGQLEPLEDGGDEMALFEAGQSVAKVGASNSVISWPQILDVTPDGRHAFVVETRGPAGEGVATYENVNRELPTGTRLSSYRVGGDGLRLVETADDIGTNLQSVEYSHGVLFIGTEDAGSELVTVAVGRDGSLGRQKRFDLTPPLRESDVERHTRTVHVSPDGSMLAVNVATRRIQFYRLARGASGDVQNVEPFGAPSLDLGARLSTAKWTPDGRFLLVTDTNGGSGLRMLLQGPGSVVALAPPADTKSAPTVVSSAEVGRFPEGFSISADGTRVAAVNLERTYLPEISLLTAWTGRRLYSVSLLSLDPETGALAELGRTYQAGILPEDVIFDESGKNLPVAVFHRRKGPERRQGFVDFFTVWDGDRLESQGVTQPVMRGVHDLVRLPRNSGSPS